MKRMKAITIHQPYAGLIVAGEKRVENRTWSTRHRGPLAIHAGMSRDWLRVGDDPDSFVYGAVVAVCDLSACIPVQKAGSESVAGRFPWLITHAGAFGPYCWVLENVRPLNTPIPMRGRQGLFTIDLDMDCWEP